MRWLVGALVLLLCAAQTHTRSQDWRSDQRLWTAADAVAPTRVRPAINLSHAYGVEGDWIAAIAWAREAQRRMTLDQAWAPLCRHLRWIDVFSPYEASLSSGCA